MTRRLSRPRFARWLWTSSVLAFAATFAPAAGPAPAEDPLLAGFRDPPREARPSTYWLWLNGYVNREHVERELQAFHDAGIRGLLIFDMGARGAREAMPPAGPEFLGDQSAEDIAHAVRVAGRIGLDAQLSVTSSWDMGGTWVEPPHASMGLYTSEVTVEGPREYDDVLPLPPVPSRAPRTPAGEPAYRKEVAVLAFPAETRLLGHDFVFRLDPPGPRTLEHAVLCNTPSDDPRRHGDLHLFTKDFSISVSTTGSAEGDFREILRASLEPTTEPQRFELPEVEARYARLRIASGHNERFDRIQLGEFELFDAEGINVVASHVADRSRDGAELVRYSSALGHDRDWTAGNIHDGARSGPAGSWSSAGPPPVLVEKIDSIVDLTDRLEQEGRLRWSVPAGSWAILRLVCLNTGERLKVPSPKSDGLATDHLSHEATRVFLDHLIRGLEAKLGDLGETSLGQLYLASYEVRGPIWTPELPRWFQHFRGYDLRPYLPVLSGKTVVSEEVTERFLYDYRKTLGDLLVDAYYRVAVDEAHAAGVEIESEAGGPGPPIHQVPVDALKALGTIDEIRGEFWPKRPDASGLWVVKETACAGHIYGKRRVHMEAFTSMHHWQDGPFDLKPSADRAFCEGANHFVWHTASHQPPEAGKPGWVYLAGTHLSTHLIWWPKARAFIDYLARCSFLLQQGLFVGDVCYYYGDQGYNFVPPKHVDPSLGFGHDYDVTNREVILTRMSVREDGRIELPDGMGYELLVLPEREDIDIDVLRKLEELVRRGATIVGPKPVRSNGLTGYPGSDQQVRRLADRLWGSCDGETVLEHRHGRGRIVWGRTPRDILRERGIGPDFSFRSPAQDTRLDFIHRRTGEADIYFVRNRRERREQFDATFRVRGRLPEEWDPATGLIRRLHEYRESGAGTHLALELEPYGSTFIVFRDVEVAPPPIQLEEPPGSSAEPLAAQVDEWDGRRARLTLWRDGRYRARTAKGLSAEVEVGDLPAPLELEGPWDVRFTGGLGDAFSSKLNNLVSWTDHPDEKIRYFSGIARYERDIELPADWLTEDRRLWLDLGGLWALGEVFLNGRSMGVVWKPPYRVEITEAAVPGQNRLAVEVANTWSNRLVGDAQRPAQERLTRTNATHSGGKPWKSVPLIRSGLFGPVRLVPAKVVTAKLEAPAVQSAAVESGPEEMHLAIGGTGGAYFLASSGELTIDLEKRDRNRTGRRTHLRAILVGPDREVLEDVALPDDGRPRGSGPGPIQRVRLSTMVERQGVYALNITVSQDRYGDDILWGFRTNCPRYVIETARGHRDERHQEPIVILQPGRPADVCFLPRGDTFRIDLNGLSPRAAAPTVHDARDRLIETLEVSQVGRVAHEFPADVHRDAVPWRLHLPVAQATVHIDGVTRWRRGELSENVCYWSPSPSAYFPLARYRWILTPYQRWVYSTESEKGGAPFVVHNHADQARSFDLEVEFPEGRSWPARLSTRRVELGPRGSREVLLEYKAPAQGDEWVCHLRITPRGDPLFSTYSTLRLQRGEAPALSPLALPLVLHPYRHEEEQLGYRPDYPLDNQVYFDPQNRPYVRTQDGVAVRREEAWTRTALDAESAPSVGLRFGRISTKIAFGGDGDLYLLAASDGRPTLLRSKDGGRTFDGCPVGDGRSGAFDIEQFSGHNIPAGPPPIVRFRQTAADPRFIWRRINDLDLFLPEESGNGLTCGEPIRISERSIGLSAHSGIPSTIVSRGEMVHVAWAEATDPDEKVPGVPTFVASYDRREKELGEPVLVGHGPPPNDIHNSPCITMDSQGHLHVLIGTHGRTFRYTRSLAPNDAAGGFTRAEEIGPGLRQTYVGMVCDREDTLHVVFRLWQDDRRYFPAGIHATLAYQRKRADGDWEPPRILVVAPFSEYSIFYHRLTIDRAGRLFLSYDYWSTYWFYRNDHRGDRRGLMGSEDGGDTWRLITSLAN